MRSRGSAARAGTEWGLRLLILALLAGYLVHALRVRYRGASLDGEIIEREVEGFHARVVQHECDHLDGILYPQRMTDHRLLVFLEELQRHPIDLAAFLAEKSAG